MQTTQTITQLVGGELVGPGDLEIQGVQSLDQANETDLTFIGDKRFAARWASASCRAALVTRGLEVETPPDRAVIYVDHADLAMAKVLEAFAPPRSKPAAGVHRSAAIDPTAQLGDGVAIGPMCVVGPGTRLGAGCVLHASVTLMADVVLGEDCELSPGVVVADRCTIGDRCILHPNVSIGADGFGYRPDPQRGVPVKIPQIGTVELGCDVEIGAGTCIDRGKFAATVIGDHVKIDNLVQVGHNCLIEPCVVIAGLCAIAGSVKIGAGAMLGGGIHIAGHLTIGGGAQIAGGSQLMHDVPEGAIWGGSPGQPMKQTAREILAVRKLPELLRQLKRG